MADKDVWTRYAEAMERIRYLEESGNELRASLVAAYPPCKLPDSAAERVSRFDALFDTSTQDPVSAIERTVNTQVKQGET